MASSPLARPAEPEAPPRTGGSRLVFDHGVPLLVIDEPSDFGAGRAAGRLMRPHLERTIGMLRRQPWRLALVLLARLVQRRLDARALPDESRDELAGWTDGLGVAPAALFALNLAYDLPGSPGVTCSTFSVADGRSVWVGRNTDSWPLLTALALRYFPTVVAVYRGGPRVPFATVGLPGFVGAFSGVNRAGLAVNAHQVLGPREVRVDRALATPLVARRVLDRARSVDEAVDLVRDRPPVRPLNLHLACPSGEAAVVEVNGDRVAVRRGAGPATVCTTHFERLLEGQTGGVVRRLSQARAARLEALLAETGSFDRERGIAVLGDHHRSMRHRGSSASIANIGTMQSYLLDHGAMRLWVATGRRRPVSLTGPYRELELGPLLGW